MTSPRIAPCTVPPELRRLRDAWAWARGLKLDVDLHAADCPKLGEHRFQIGGWFLAGATVTGGGLVVTLTDDTLQIARNEGQDNDTTIVLLLPARLRRAVPVRQTTPTTEPELAR